MDYHQQFRCTAIERGIPEEGIRKFAEFLRFAVHADVRPNSAPVGQFGGLPRLPVGMEWPSSDEGPLPFIASLDCATLPRVDSFPLPADGSLLFFLHHEWAYFNGAEQEYARVVYVPAGTETTTAEEPDHTGQMFYNSELDFVGPKCKLFATVGAELPSWFDEELLDDDELLEVNGKTQQSGALEHLGWNLTHREELCALAEELYPGDGGAISLGGHSSDIREVMTDHMYSIPETMMALDIVTARRKAGDLADPLDEQDPQIEKETLRVMREWVVLAEFSPDDYYIGRFMIRYDDLAAGRFDRARSFTAFTE
ncbi:DUF1963 domain-containing protein [Streptomyces sp. NPDC056600]|uniref:DUF1963 domain-containing protein n=1 Tax=Streptomyces sp. NPDC056600 TaxID=3345874 RepID=UPI00368F6B2B